MTMFTGFFDGSGSPDDTAAVVVAGFIAPAEQWIEFERNWKDMLRDFGVSSLHMREYAHSVGDFASWKGDKKKRARFMGRAINIILTRVQHSFASAVVMDDYRRVDAKYRLSEFVKPLTLAGCTCVNKAHHWARKHMKEDDKIAFVFEDGDTDKGDLMRSVKQHFPGITPNFLTKDRSVAFQAADLLAYEHLQANKKVMKAGLGVLGLEDLRYPLQAMSKVPGARSDDWGFHLEDELIDSCIRDNIAKREEAA
jgi:hypothetical protein